MDGVHTEAPRGDDTFVLRGEREIAPSSTEQEQKKGEAPKTDGEKPLTREMDLVRTPGAILRVKVDPEHWLGFGYDRDTAATVQSNYAFTLSKTALHVAAFPGEDQLELAGFMWPEAREGAREVAVRVGRAGRTRPGHLLCGGSELPRVAALDPADVLQRGDPGTVVYYPDGRIVNAASSSPEGLRYSARNAITGSIRMARRAGT